MELFVYGGFAAALEQITGKKHAMKRALLPGYRHIEDRHTVVKWKDGSVAGKLVTDITQDDIIKLDALNPENTRTVERVHAGKKLYQAFVYVNSDYSLKELERSGHATVPRSPAALQTKAAGASRI
ncbi:MAG: gamma-glutamylcyclotransferase [Candidatus Aenigmarchaeota archaeon]|nr:gamma-glutamylcyclotransferase [Candidatus Aenigmarchaeota archaeon]